MKPVDPHQAAFPLTEEERARLARGPAPNDPGHWRWMASAVLGILVDCYRDGDVTFERMFEIMRGCALGCDAAARVMLLGMLAERTLTTKPTKIARDSKYSRAQQRIAARLVRHVYEEQGIKLEAALLDTIPWLVWLGICDESNPISVATLRDWYINERRATGAPVRIGRPPDRE